MEVKAQSHMEISLMLSTLEVGELRLETLLQEVVPKLEGRDKMRLIREEKGGHNQVERTVGQVSSCIKHKHCTRSAALLITNHPLLDWVQFL